GVARCPAPGHVTSRDAGHRGTVAEELPEDRILQRLKARVDDIRRDPDRRPASSLAVGALDEDASHGLDAARGDADAEVDELHVLDEGLVGAEVLAERAVE